MEEMVRSAIGKKLSYVAFTEHFDVLSDSEGDAHYMEHEADRLQEQARLQKKYKRKLNILYGIELGQPHHNPELAERFLRMREFDFVLGSLHFYKCPTGNYHDVYLIDYSHISPSIMFCNYFLDMIRMIDYGGFDVIAHLDYPLRVLEGYIGQPTIKDYKDLVDSVLKIAVQKGLGLEIGTRGLLDWQQRVGPEDWVLRRFRELGGEIVTTGSDSHSTSQIGSGLTEACYAAGNAGFTSIAYYKKRKPVFVKIEL